MNSHVRPPAVLLRRDEVLAFIMEQIARTGTSPSFEEISHAFAIGKTRAKELVRQLVERGRLEKTPGAQRNLRVRDVAGARDELEEVLRRLGWHTAKPMGELLQACPQGHLPVLPPFEHLPDVD